MTLFVIYFFISGLGFPITLGLLIRYIKINKAKSLKLKDYLDYDDGSEELYIKHHKEN